MLKLTLIGDSTNIQPSRLISLYADPDTWFLAVALFQMAEGEHVEYTGIKDLIFDWDLLKCHKVEGAEAVATTDIPAALLELHELMSSSIILNDISIGTVRDAVIDESTLHIDAFLADHKENGSSRTLFLESDWCSWSRSPESHLLLRVPFDQVKRFLE